MDGAMRDSDRLRRAMREIGLGLGSIVVIVILFIRASAALVEFAVLLIAVGAMYWSAKVPRTWLVGFSGRMLFGGLIVGLFLTAASIAVRATLGPIATFLVLVAATITAILRRLAARPPNG